MSSPLESEAPWSPLGAPLTLEVDTLQAPHSRPWPDQFPATSPSPAATTPRPTPATPRPTPATSRPGRFRRRRRPRPQQRPRRPRQSGRRPGRAVGAGSGPSFAVAGSPLSLYRTGWARLQLGAVRAARSLLRYMSHLSTARAGTHSAHPASPEHNRQSRSSINYFLSGRRLWFSK